MAVIVEGTIHANIQLKATTKDCFVVLQRLDEELLNRYLRRDIKDSSSRNATQRAAIKRGGQQTRQRKKLEGLPVKGASRRNKRKRKPLCYTDDEDSSTDTKPLKDVRVTNAGSDSQAREEKKPEPIDMGCKVETTEEEERDEVSIGTVDSGCAGDSCCGAVDSEIQIIKEFPRRGNVTCDKAKAICDVRFIADNESEHPELGSEDESRDEDEDDRKTVIFEKEADLEVLEFDEKEISKKFKNKKITNRKKQRLVKFKRKSMSVRNLGKFRKSKSKLSESGGAGQDAAEKGLSDCIAEDCLREVCISVRRLHEMYTIILQLQREMPKDTELAVHFKRVISAQQENFHREIRKTQKLIIRSFEKMLKSCSNSLDKVAMEVGKRTYLTAEEVIYILSLCMLSEGSCDADKSRSGSVEKTEQPKSCVNNLCKVRLTKKVTPPKSSKPKTSPQEVVSTEVPDPAPPPRPNLPPPPRPNLPPPSRPNLPPPSRPNLPPPSRPNLPPPPRPNLPPSDVSHQPGPPQPQIPVALAPPSKGQPCSNPVEKYNQRYLCAQQNFESARINDLRMRQCREMNPRPPVLRQPVPLIQPNTVPHGCSIPYFNQHFLYPPRPRPPSDCSLYATMKHYQQGNVAPSVPGGPPVVPFRVPPQRQFNYIPDKPNPSQSSPVLVQNTPGYSVFPNRISECDKTSHIRHQAPINTQRNFPPLETVDCSVVNGHVILTPRNGSQCHLQFANSVEYSNARAEKPPQQRPAVPVVLGDDRSFGTNPTADKTSDVPEVLDPTIPQKLTMKNCRLQAGPVLGDRGSSEGGPKRPENPDPEHSRSRVYICAGNGCKNPGVRICSFCQSVIYCSETCQLKHWDLKHKAECCQLRELRG